jgi:OmpA-OmpF porin, OOP family
MRRRAIAVNMLVVLVLAWVSTSTASGDEVKGMIMARTGEALIVSTPGGKVTVLLNASTRTKDDKGLFGLDKEEMADTVLIPGLKVRVEGSVDGQGRFVAETITVDGDDLEASQMIQAGLHPTATQVEANVQAIEVNKRGVAANQQNIATNQQNIAANQQNIDANKQKIEQNIKDIQENTDRFSRLDDYEVKGQAAVNFASGSIKMSPEDQTELQHLAEHAMGLSGYIIEVKGFADSRGNATMNERLSEDRAKAVVGYLMRQCNVPVFRIVAPGAMGEFQPAASNEDAKGRAENRRVEVKVLVNKGVTGS